MSDSYVIRVAKASDADLIAHHRAAMFRDMGAIAADDYAVLRRASEPWIGGLLADGGYQGWIAEQGGAPVAGGGVWIREQGPRPGCPRIGRWAHVINVYTEPEHRRRGLARRVMRAILEWCRDGGFDHVTLTASEEGRPLYESLGFSATSDMKLRS